MCGKVCNSPTKYLYSDELGLADNKISIILYKNNFLIFPNYIDVI